MTTTPSRTRHPMTGTHVGAGRYVRTAVITAAALAGLVIAIASVSGSDARTSTIPPLITHAFVPAYPQGLSEAFGPHARAAVVVSRPVPATLDGWALGAAELSLAFGVNAPAAVISDPAAPTGSFSISP